MTRSSASRTASTRRTTSPVPYENGPQDEEEFGIEDDED